MIGATIDWAENYTQRSLGELLELNSPTDSSATALPEPVDSPDNRALINSKFDIDPTIDTSLWNPAQWHEYWRLNPVEIDSSRALRRDVKEALLIKLEALFDRNPETMQPMSVYAENMLFPYRKGMGV